MLRSHLVIGEITKPQGVRGELKLRPITCDPERFEGLTLAYFKRGDKYEPVKLKVNRLAPDAVFLNIEGVTDRNQAERLRGELLYIDRAHAVELDEDSDFICDLIGLTGKDDSGRTLGTLKDVMQPGGNDVYVFQGGYGEVLVPALKSVVIRVDYEAEVMYLSRQRLDEVAVFDDED